MLKENAINLLWFFFNMFFMLFILLRVIVYLEGKISLKNFFKSFFLFGLLLYLVITSIYSVANLYFAIGILLLCLILIVAYFRFNSFSYNKWVQKGIILIFFFLSVCVIYSNFLSITGGLSPSIFASKYEMFVKKNRITIGSGEKSDFVVMDKFVDPVHVEVELKGSKLVVKNISRHRKVVVRDDKKKKNEDINMLEIKKGDELTVENEKYKYLGTFFLPFYYHLNLKNESTGKSFNVSCLLRSTTHFGGRNGNVAGIKFMPPAFDFFLILSIISLIFMFIFVFIKGIKNLKFFSIILIFVAVISVYLIFPGISIIPVSYNMLFLLIFMGWLFLLIYIFIIGERKKPVIYSFFAFTFFLLVLFFLPVFSKSKVYIFYPKMDVNKKYSIMLNGKPLYDYEKVVVGDKLKFIIGHTNFELNYKMEKNGIGHFTLKPSSPEKVTNIEKNEKVVDIYPSTFRKFLPLKNAVFLKFPHNFVVRKVNLKRKERKIVNKKTFEKGNRLKEKTQEGVKENKKKSGNKVEICGCGGREIINLDIKRKMGMEFQIKAFYVSLVLYLICFFFYFFFSGRTFSEAKGVYLVIFFFLLIMGFLLRMGLSIYHIRFAGAFHNSVIVGVIPSILLFSFMMFYKRVFEFILYFFYVLKAELNRWMLLFILLLTVILILISPLLFILIPVTFLTVFLIGIKKPYTNSFNEYVSINSPFKKGRMYEFLSRRFEIKKPFIREVALKFFNISYILMIDIVFFVILIGVFFQWILGSEVGIGVGGFTLQLFEFAKVLLVIYLADWTFRLYGNRNRIRSELYLLIMLPMIFLMVLVHDFSPFILFSGIIFMHLIITEENIKYIVKLLNFAGVFLFLVLYLIIGYPIFLICSLISFFVWSGITLFVNRESAKNSKLLKLLKVVSFSFIFLLIPLKYFILKILGPTNVFRIRTYFYPWVYIFPNMQIVRSFFFLKSNSIWGNIVDAFKYATFVPQIRDDFVFALFTKSYGVMGVTNLFLSIVLFLLFSLNIFLYKHKKSSALDESRWEGFILLFLSIIFVLQFFLPAASTIGIMPVMGQPLPFFAYANSSLLLFSTMIFGILVNLVDDVEWKVGEL